MHLFKVKKHEAFVLQVNVFFCRFKTSVFHGNTEGTESSASWMCRPSFETQQTVKQTAAVLSCPLCFQDVWFWAGQQLHTTQWQRRVWGGRWHQLHCLQGHSGEKSSSMADVMSSVHSVTLCLCSITVSVFLSLLLPFHVSLSCPLCFSSFLFFFFWLGPSEFPTFLKHRLHLCVLPPISLNNQFALHTRYLSISPLSVSVSFLPLLHPPSSIPFVHHRCLYWQGCSAQSYVEVRPLFEFFS